MYDDGGINERLFSILSVPHVFFATAVIAIVEEGLFRGVLQAHFGLIIASLIFAVLHIRYLQKIVLFIVTVALSFLLGLLFWYTQNLLVCMFVHFVIDFVQGAAIRIRHKRFHHVQEEAGWMAPMEEKNEIYEETGEDHASLPSRKEYHGRKTKRKKRKSPFLLSRVLLAAFIILVVAALVFSISNYHFS
ncbi:MAG TPA: CPBP family intramembrane glutamic endopeptidase [Bacillales bacterium]|nr:CPBP family intramembrane glutamic endopeptidase [Bacillales bacterium]